MGSPDRAREELESFLAWPAGQVQQAAGAPVPAEALALARQRLRHHLGELDVPRALDATTQELRAHGSLGRDATRVVLVARALARPHVQTGFDGGSVEWLLSAA